MLVIEVVDAGLVAWMEGERIAGPSPGVALLDPAGVVVGSRAMSQQRLRPVHAFDRFWSELDNEQLPRPVGAVTRRVDLAFNHLQDFVRTFPAGPPMDAVLAVPGSMKPRQLGLLAGLAQAAGLSPVGFVDLAVAAGSSLSVGPRALHLDLHLHQAIITELTGQQMLRRSRVDVAPRVGLRALHECWARWIAGSMVSRTRFDPLHHATTEQSLMDQLPVWMEALEYHEEVEAVIDSAHGRVSTLFTREEAVLAAEAFYAQIMGLVRNQISSGAVTLMLGHRARGLPGLAERLQALGGVELLRLDPAAVPMGLKQWTGVDKDALVTALPREQALSDDLPPSTVPARVPTHLLYGGQAHRLRDGELSVGLDPCGEHSVRLLGKLPGVSRQHCRFLVRGGGVELRDDSQFGTWVNGRRVRGSRWLSAGDKVRVGSPGVFLDLIEVE